MRNAPKSFVDSEFILRLVSEKDIENKEKYRLLLRQGRDLEPAHVLEQEDAIERFRVKLAGLFPAIFKMVGEKRRLATLLGIHLPTLEELEKQIEIVREEYNNSRPESKKAKKYLIQQLISRGYTRSEIAERLGVSRKTIYNILKASL